MLAFKHIGIVSNDKNTFLGSWFEKPVRRFTFLKTKNISIFPPPWYLTGVKLIKCWKRRKFLNKHFRLCTSVLMSLSIGDSFVTKRHLQLVYMFNIHLKKVNFCVQSIKLWFHTINYLKTSVFGNHKWPLIYTNILSQIKLNITV